MPNIIRKYVFLLICAFVLGNSHTSLFGQTNRGSLLNEGVPVRLSSYFTSDSLLNLDHIREVSNLLTNPNITNINGKPIAQRKKAFIRHVKHLNEDLEESWRMKNKPGEEILELVYELEWYRSSLIQKTESNQEIVMPFGKKFNMLKSTLLSKKTFTYQIPTHTDVAIADPLDSPFWHRLSDTIRPLDQFDLLSEEKKIKPKKNMVVLACQYSNSGSGAKIETFDLDLDNKWLLKWGDEVHTDVLASRIFAGLGYDVDHPYHYSENLTLVFEDTSQIKSAATMIDTLINQYGVDIRPFISKTGVISQEMTIQNKKLEPFVGRQFLQFKDCSLEARPDRVKRLGSIIPEELGNADRQELNGALLAHQFIGNWDTREDNTVLTIVHRGNYQYRPSAVFSDLGSSLGVEVSWTSQDFKAGLVNKLDWEAAVVKHGKLKLTNRINSILTCYSNATYYDLFWMAIKIAELDERDLRMMINEAHFPTAIGELYFHKLASRRESILISFGIQDPNPIHYNRKLNILADGEFLVKNGKLVKDIDSERHPEGFIHTKGRGRNYGR